MPFRVNLEMLPEKERRSPAEARAALEAELPGILNWLLDGLAALMALGGLRPPDEAQLFKDVMLSGSDPVQRFLEQHTRPSPGAMIITRPEFNRTIALYCQEEGFRRISPPVVGRTMEARGYRLRLQRGVRFWSGLVWADDDATRDLRERAAP